MVFHSLVVICFSGYQFLSLDPSERKRLILAIRAYALLHGKDPDAAVSEASALCNRLSVCRLLGEPTGMETLRDHLAKTLSPEGLSEERILSVPGRKKTLETPTHNRI